MYKYNNLLIIWGRANDEKKIIIGLFIVIILVAARGIIEEQERTNEEYVSILLDNREDFEYVAGIMQKWDFRRIYFKKDDMINGNSEIAEEIATNEEFYMHLKNLYDLNEVDSIFQMGDCIEFGFERPSKDYHGGWYYWEDTEEGGLMKTAVIDEHWTLEMLPNV